MIDSILIEENNNYEQITNIINKRINVEKSLCTVDRDARPYSIDERDELLFQKRVSRPHYIKIDAYLDILDDPYFARLDYRNNSEDENICYIGKKAFINNHDIIIHDWRSTIGQVFYNKASLKFNYCSEICKVILRRLISIQNCEVKRYQTEYQASYDNILQELSNNNLTDPFLIQVLKEKRNNSKLTDIIETIQSNQNKVISLPSSYNLIVQGCAGSGKTMVLLHRLSYLKYNNMISTGNTIIITPNSYFNNYIGELTSLLELQNIRRYSITEYYDYLLNKYYSTFINFQVYKDKKFISDNLLDKDFISQIYSMETFEQLKTVLLEYLTEFYDLLDITRIGQVANKYMSLTVPKKKRCYKTLTEIYSVIKKIILQNNNKLTKYNNFSIELQDLIGQKTRIDKEIVDHKDPLTGLNKNEIEDEYYNEIRNYSSLLLNRGLIDNLNDMDTYFDFNKHLEDIINENVINQKEHFLRSEIIYKLMNEIKNDKEKQESLQQNYKEERKKTEKIIVDLENQLTLIRKINPKYYIKFNRLKKTKLLLQSINETYCNQLNSIKEIIITKEIKARIYKESVDLIETNLLWDKDVDLLKSNVKKINYYTNFLLECDNKIKVLITSLNKKIEKVKECMDKLVKELLSNEEKNFIESKIELFLKLESEKLYTTTFGKYINIIKENYNVPLQKHFDFEKYLLLHFCSIYYDPVIKTDLHINIDEAQDISVAEINMIRNVNDKNAVYNLYGDIDQVVNFKGITKWDDISFIYNFYYLKENFRNTNQITIFSNEKCNTNMQAIGLEGIDVKTINNFDIFENTIKLLSKANERVAIIINKTDAKYNNVRRFINQNNIINISIFSVIQSKGLEFEKVFVFSKSMTQNERYVAFTRALKELTIVDI